MTEAIPDSLRRAVIARDHRRCMYCGAPIPQSEEPDVDHIWPRALGGTDDPSNLCCAHASCNRSKGARLMRPMPIEYWQQRDTLARMRDAQAQQRARFALELLGLLVIVTAVVAAALVYGIPAGALVFVAVCGAGLIIWR